MKTVSSLLSLAFLLLITISACDKESLSEGSGTDWNNFVGVYNGICHDTLEGTVVNYGTDTIPLEIKLPDGGSQDQLILQGETLYWVSGTDPNVEDILFEWVKDDGQSLKEEFYLRFPAGTDSLYYYEDSNPYSGATLIRDCACAK